MKNFKSPNLKVLDLSYNKIENIYPFKDFSKNEQKIEKILLNNNEIGNVIGLFSRKELEELDPKVIECQYKNSCYEGDKLLWYRVDKSEGPELCAKLEDGKEIFFAKLSR